MKTLNDNVNCDCVCSCPTPSKTHAEEEGIYVGQGVYKYNGESDDILNHGDIVVLANDDGSRCPLFQRIDWYMKSPCHDGHVSRTAHATFAYVWEVEELAPATDIPETPVCTCKCTCSPAKLFGLTVGKTVVRVNRGHMTDYGMYEGALAVFVEDDDSDCPRFQRLEEYLQHPATECSMLECSCYLGLGDGTDRIEIVPNLEITS